MYNAFPLTSDNFAQQCKELTDIASTLGARAVAMGTLIDVILLRMPLAQREQTLVHFRHQAEVLTASLSDRQLPPAFHQALREKIGDLFAKLTSLDPRDG
jgi:hypothetical protein